MIIVATVTPPPPPPPPPPVRVETAFQVTLVGTDGTPWDLNAGPVFLEPGVKLFGTAPLDHTWKTSPLRDGSRWAGVRTEQHDITLPVSIEASDWTTWRATDAAFFRSLAPESEATLVVTAPDGTSRSLAVRFVGDGDAEDEQDPLLQNIKAYSLQFVAASPFWRGDDVDQTFQQEDAQDFLVTTAGSTLFYISSDASFQAASVTNAGDVKSYPVYTISGPATTWAAGVGDSVMTSSRALSASESVTVDVESLSITNQDGARVWEWLDTKTFAAIPPGTDIPLSITVTGYTSDTAVSVNLPTLYRRPW